MFRFVRRAMDRIYIAIFGAILAVLLIADRRMEYYARNEMLLWPNLPLALLAAAVLGTSCFFLARKRGKAVFPANGDGGGPRPCGVLWALGAALFAAQVFISWNICFLSGWDVAAVRNAVRDLTGPAGAVQNTWEFDVYPNNIFFVAVLTVIHRMAAAVHIEPNGAYIAAACLTTSMAAVLVGLTLYDLSGSSAVAYGGFGVSAALFGLSPWITIPYTDGYGILFPVLTLYLYVRMRKWDGPVLLRQIAVLLPAGIGSLIKPQCVIVAIAIVMVEALNALRMVKENARQCARYVAAAVCSILIVLATAGGLSAWSQRYTGLRENEDMAMVPMHYVMMGLNTERDGCYLWDDVSAAQMFPGKSAKTAFCASMARERIAEMGVGGLAAHLIKKTLGNYNDGTFAWSQEGNFYEMVLQPPCGVLSEAMRGFYYWDGAYNRWFVNGEQFIWLCVLLAGFAGALSGRHTRQEDPVSAVRLSLIGITLFLLVFESRARYLYIYAPLFVIAAGMGFAATVRAMANAVEKRRVKKGTIA